MSPTGQYCKGRLPVNRFQITLKCGRPGQLDRTLYADSFYRMQSILSPEIKEDVAVDNLDGKWALVTGASSGIGVDLARLFAKAGCNVVITARRLDRLQAVEEKQLPISILVNNAGIGLI